MQDVFRTFVATLLARVNTLTGVAYRCACMDVATTCHGQASIAGR